MAQDDCIIRTEDRRPNRASHMPMTRCLPEGISIRFQVTFKCVGNHDIPTLLWPQKHDGCQLAAASSRAGSLALAVGHGREPALVSSDDAHGQKGGDTRSLEVEACSKALAVLSSDEAHVGICVAPATPLSPASR